MICCCTAATVITDPATIKITWETSGQGAQLNSTEGAKWWAEKL